MYQFVFVGCCVWPPDRHCALAASDCDARFDKHRTDRPEDREAGQKSIYKKINLKANYLTRV